MKNNNKINKKNGRKNNFINTTKLGIAMGIAGALATPTQGFSKSEITTNINISDTINLVNVSDYQELIKQRDSYIKNNWNNDHMDPNLYFVLNQKAMFLKDVKLDSDGLKYKLNSIEKILKEKFKKDLKGNPTNTIKTALQVIATEDSHKDFNKLTSVLSDDFDVNLINAYGYLQTNMPGIVCGHYGTSLPMIELNIELLDRILYILENGEYTADFIESKNNFEQRNKGNNSNNADIKEDSITDTEYTLDDWLGTGETDIEEKIEIEEKPKEVIEDPVIIENENTQEIVENIDEVDNEYTLDEWLGTGETNNEEVKKEIEEKIQPEKIITEDGTIDVGNSVEIIEEVDDEDLLKDLESIQKDAIIKLERIQKKPNADKTNKDYSDERVLTKAIADSKVQIENIKNKIKNSNTVVGNNNNNNNNIDIINNISRNADILSQKLNQDKLDNISYQDIIDIVNGFKSIELQKAFMYALLDNDIIYAQKLMGMDLTCSDHYPNYMASKKLGKDELRKIKRLGGMRKYMQEKEIMANKYIPQDVKDAYLKFVDGVFDNKGLPYNILSKTDMKLYMFSDNNILLTRQNMLIGKHVGDQKNSPPSSKTTPGGMYEINMKYRTDQNSKNMFDKYDSHYITLYPLDGQYKYPNSKNYTLGVHGLYVPEIKQRSTGIKSSSSNSHRMSAGCPNAVPERFGGIYNQFEFGSMLFVTYEPDSKEIQNFRDQIK